MTVCYMCARMLLFVNAQMRMASSTQAILQSWWGVAPCKSSTARRTSSSWHKVRRRNCSNCGQHSPVVDPHLAVLWPQGHISCFITVSWCLPGHCGNVCWKVCAERGLLLC